MQDQLLDQVAFIAHRWLRQPIRGIVVRFYGLGWTGMKSEPDIAEMEWANAGALVVVPYNEPWAWMNPATRNFVDEVVDSLRARYKLDANVPLIATGGSMGGHASLAYTMFSRHHVAACQACWPVCDLTYHYNERPDLPRTFHHAFGSYGDIQSVLAANSPLQQVERLPKVPYMIAHGEKDEAVSKKHHSDRLVPAMRARGLDVTYLERTDMGHGNPLDWELWRALNDFVIAQLRH
jgi:dipeptidyl aminopeptidase/acylaminoacyl peptidase